MLQLAGRPVTHQNEGASSQGGAPWKLLQLLSILAYSCLGGFPVHSHQCWANTGFSGQNMFLFVFYFGAVLCSLWGEQTRALLFSIYYFDIIFDLLFGFFVVIDLLFMFESLLKCDRSLAKTLKLPFLTELWEVYTMQAVYTCTYSSLKMTDDLLDPS